VIKPEVLLYAVVIVRPPLVRRHDIAVPAVSCCPIEDIVEFNVLRVVRTFQEVQNPHLKQKVTVREHEVLELKKIQVFRYVRPR
jgi:hypothetical protein